MYIKQLEGIDNIKWLDIFIKNKILNKDKQDSIKSILTQNKTYIELHFEELKELGVINGIGSEKFGKWSIILLTKLLKGVRYEWHDIMYFVGGSEIDKKNADYGLFKYSLISISEQIRKLLEIDINMVLKLPLWMFGLLLAILYPFLSFIAYTAVLVGGNKAFYFHK